MSPSSPPPPPELETVESDASRETMGTTCVEIGVGPRRVVVDLAAEGDVVIGRSAQATLMVEDERISRQHLRLSLRDGVLFAVDLGSRNGTLLNGRRLDGERRLRGGDELEAGPVRLRVGGARPPGLLTEGELIDRLDEEIERAARYRRPLSVAGVALEGPPRAIDDAITRLIGHLGRMVSVGEYTPLRLLAVLPEQAPATVASWRALMVEIAGVEAVVTTACVPDDGVSADELLAAVFAARPARPPQPEPARTLIAEDAQTREVFEMARRVAPSLASVLITGETGVGKEWVASELHLASPRGKGPFVRVNCAALPETLIEAELFGHEKGAFTGADRRRIGRLESAHGGTLFLDEIGELPLSTQAKLLHALEDHTVVRIGSNQAQPVDVRFVAATHRDLEADIRAGRFREDLYFRLVAIALCMPPLRERPLDRIALANHFLLVSARAAGKTPPRMSTSFRAALDSYPWPGNVRELKNVMERAVVLAEGDELGPRHLPERVRVSDAAPGDGGPMRRRLEEVERASLDEALDACGGNRTHAARKLGISRRALIYKLQKLGATTKR